MTATLDNSNRLNKFRAWLARKIYKSSVTIYSTNPLDVHVDGTELRFKGRLYIADIYDNVKPMNEWGGDK